MDAYGYAKMDFTITLGIKSSEKMHRVIMYANKDQEIDHINGNRLDNRKENLRFCTRSQNNINRTVLSKNNKSGYTGISWDNKRNKWRATISIGYKHIHIGYFSSLEKATGARNMKAFQLFGEFIPNSLLT